jgi:hypothetical protein
MVGKPTLAKCWEERLGEFMPLCRDRQAVLAAGPISMGNAATCRLL